MDRQDSGWRVVTGSSYTRRLYIDHEPALVLCDRSFTQLGQTSRLTDDELDLTGLHLPVAGLEVEGGVGGGVTGDGLVVEDGLVGVGLGEGDGLGVGEGVEGGVEALA
jgi:hypothetical protein